MRALGDNKDQPQGRESRRGDCPGSSRQNQYKIGRQNPRSLEDTALTHESGCKWSYTGRLAQSIATVSMSRLYHPILFHFIHLVSLLTIELELVRGSDQTILFLGHMIRIACAWPDGYAAASPQAVRLVPYCFDRGC
jgi:hypothetical protein